MQKLIRTFCFNRKALTLTELLVSSVLMGVVMVGIAGYSATLKRMFDTSDKQTILAMQAATVIGHIERNVVMSSGYLKTGEPNFSYVQFLGNPQDYWSFRTDPNNTPMQENDDTWAIIFRDVAGPDQYDLYACFQGVGVGPGLGPNPDNGNTPCGANRIRLVTNRLQSITMNRVINASPSVLDMYVDVDMTISQNPTCVAPTVGCDDPFDDPAFRMTTRIPMTSHSWN